MNGNLDSRRFGHPRLYTLPGFPAIVGLCEGMLERTAGCLESRSLRRLLPSCKNSLKSRRTLHSGFWNHAASDIELSPLWGALVRGLNSQQEHIVPEQRISSSSGGLFLDFLYPPGAINFLRNYSGWVLDRKDCLRGRAGLVKSGQRLYSSSAIDGSINTLTAAPRGDGEALEAKEDIGEADIMRHKLGIGEKYDCDEAWRNYLLLDESDQKQVRHFMILYYSTSKRVLESERIIDLFNELDLQDRDTKMFYYSIRAHLRLQNPQDARRLYETVLATFDVPVGSDQLLSYLMKKSSWADACKIWSSANQLLERHSNLSYGIYSILEKQSNYKDLVCQFADYTNNTLEDPARNPSEDPPDLLRFAKELIGRALLHSHSLSTTMLSTLIGHLQQWGALSPEAFKHAVDVLSDMKERNLIIKLYRNLREAKTLKFARPTLHKILRVFCSGNSTLGMQQVLDDFFHYYGKPTAIAYKMCMAKFAAQGDAKTVKELFDQFKNHHTSHKWPLADPNYFTPILQAHSKRGEIAEVVSTFDSISHEYGLKPTLMCWNILINAYGRVQDVDNAFACFESLLNSSGLKPDDYTFATLMGIAISRGDHERVIEIYKLAEDLKVSKSCAMVDCVVQAHIQNNDLSGAEDVCEEAVKFNLNGSRTRMWNYLMVAYAMRRDLENANRILQRMSELEVNNDEYTYAALMQALAMVRQPHQAHKILKTVLPRAGVRPTSFHYAILMGGYLAVGEVAQVFRLHNTLSRRDIPSSASTNLLLLKAATKQDVQLLDQGSKSDKFQRAMEMFLDMAVKPLDISGRPGKGMSSLPPDIAYPTSLYGYIMHVAGQENEFQTVQELYERYKSVVFKHRQDEPPLEIISALMAAKLRERDIAGVQECWTLALDKAKADVQRLRFKRTFRGGDPIPEVPVRAPRGQQFVLTKCLSWYLKSLNFKGGVDQMVTTVDGLLEMGFALDNHNWNTYVRVLCGEFRVKLAFEVCERKLMPGFTGWAQIRRRLPVRNRLPIAIRNLRKDSRYLRPMPHTVLALADSYLRLQEAAAEEPGNQRLIQDIRISYPRTVSAVESMQHSDDPMEELVLHRQ